MPSYHFPAEAGAALPDTRPEAITARLDRLGLSHDGVRIDRRGDTVILEGRVADAATEELLVLATGNLAGIAHVRDQLTAGQAPGLLDSLGALPFPCRWSARWIALDKADAELELVKLRKRWFAKRKGVGVLLREAITKEEVPLLAMAREGDFGRLLQQVSPALLASLMDGEK